MATSDGTFLWYELMTTDVQGALSFYEKVVGHTVQEFEGEKPYFMLVAGEKPIAGVMELPEEAKQMGAPPHWLAYIGTSDVDTSLKQIEGLGGKILVPGTDIPKVGRFGVFADPQGAVSAVYTSADPMDGEFAPVSGSVCWNELMTSDIDKDFAFYAEAFGWTKDQLMDMGPMGGYQLFKAGESVVGGVGPQPPQTPAAFWLYYLMVDDLDAAIARLSEGGGRVVSGPIDVPDGRVAQCVDPQGAMFALHALNPEA